MILSLFLIAYRLLWAIFLPVVLLYIWLRGRKDPAYHLKLAERFGVYDRALPQRPIWFHVVSLGETRSAAALIRAALNAGETVVLTHFTPAGRRESARLFAPEIASGRLAAVWVPFDMRWCFKRFFKACQPKIGLTLEIEIWPAMIFAAKAAGVPLYMCNAQYPKPSMARDAKGLRLRQRVIAGFAGAFVKSDIQAARFAAIGVENIHVTGELRFDTPIAPALLEGVATVKAQLPQTREVITIASGVEVEEPLYKQVIRARITAAQAEGREPPLFVYVPRAPERFRAVTDDLRAEGLRVLPRSEAAPPNAENLPLLTAANWADVDVLLGDSLGEMFFYLGLSDRVVVGGGFNPRGAHNIIEPLMLMKPVLTGPWTWTIEFPFEEAAAAGVARSLPQIEDLGPALALPDHTDPAAIKAFLAQHSGASRRTWAAIEQIIAPRA